MIDKIVSTAKLGQNGATSEISLRLEPEQLGVMRVRLSMSDQHNVSARIQVETVEAKALIENSLHRLRESFAEQGLKVEKFNVDVRQDQNHNGNEQNAMSGKDAGYRGARRTLSEFADLSGQPSMENFSPQPDKPSLYSARSLGDNTVEWVA